MDILQIKLDQLIPHPDNRPLGINDEKVDQLAGMMRQNGFDQSKLLKVRPNGSDGTYQIIEGEHRWRAAQKAGIEAVPAFVIDVDDEEALIQLVAGNVQTDNHPLDIGLSAMTVVSRHSKKGLDGKTFGDRIGVNGNTVNEYIKAARVYTYIKQNTTGRVLLQDVSKLTLISRCKESDWLWFHDLIASKGLSKNDVTEISKRIRSIDKAAGEHAAKVFDLTEVKQEIATAKERIYNDWISLIEAVESCAIKLNEIENLYRYGFADKAVEEYVYNPRETFLLILSELKQPTKADIFKHYNAILKTIRQQTKENADNDKKHYENKVNLKEAEERESAEWEAFLPEVGKWYELGEHRLYCGDNTDKAFIDGLPDNAAFAFADPPYNANVAEWDSGFVWNQDYLINHAKFVAITPGLWDFQNFMLTCKMPYQWTICAYNTNAMSSRGKMGFGLWNPVLIYSNSSVHLKVQDVIRYANKTSESEELSFKGKKSLELMIPLVKLFSKEGDFVIDPFCGSGSTLIASMRTLRVFVGAEKDPFSVKGIMERFKIIKKLNNIKC